MKDKVWCDDRFRVSVASPFQSFNGFTVSKFLWASPVSMPAAFKAMPV
ncbi:MAG: hypothetical protein II060_07425 [Bacteroidales bacterium]|nr:hypothetical protein [Bacteroidales bacterium]MBQ1732233.1 hypothetical protein [Bacteroidales bacterium]